MEQYDVQVTVNYITSPALYKFVFVFYSDNDGRIPSDHDRKSDYAPIHHTRQNDIDEITARYDLPDWKQYKRSSGTGSWLGRWGIDMKSSMERVMKQEGIVLFREIQGKTIRVKYVWGDNVNFIPK